MVHGNIDYQHFKERLEAMDLILRESGLDALFMNLSLSLFIDRSRAAGVEPSAKALAGHQERSCHALRCTVLGNMTGRSLREQSMDLALSPLYRQFCGLECLGLVKAPGKSTLWEYRQWLPEEQMREMNDLLVRAASGQCEEVDLGLGEELDVNVLWADSTCLDANIHFPTDWVLLRDAVRTLVKSILTIRRHGLLHRIGAPEEFMAKMNKLTMEMSAQGRRSGSKKERKRVLRAMKKLTRLVRKHALRYRELLDTRWQETGQTRRQAERILARMDQVLKQLPAAIAQAHERIIGERKVANKDKILSFYEEDIHLIVRRKAGAQIEYGNSLFVVEQADGMVVDYELLRETSPGDSKWLANRLERLQSLQSVEAPLGGLVTDRGFDSKALREQLEEEGIYNGLCPLDPQELTRRMEEDDCFGPAQKRRAGTEARIAILTHNFLGAALKGKGFGHRQLAVAWSVLTHNVWLLARKRCHYHNEQEALARAA